jgi:multiple inositol-polyphosphate phosphatase/2,3-bisphosphoglycerate 3-phosphatase
MLRMAHFYTNRQASLLVAVATVVAGLLVLIHTPIHFMAPFTVDNDYDFSNATLLLADEVSPPFHPVNMFMATYARYNTEQGNKKINRVPEQCKLVHLSMIARHGTRQPHRREIYQFKKLERVLQKHRHKSWPEWLANWQNPYTLSKAGSLTTQGKYDLASLAKRDVQRYDKWLGKTAYERHKHARYLTYTVPQ